MTERSVIRRSRVSAAGLLLRHGRPGRVGTVLLALLVGVAVFAVAAAPRALASLADRELAYELAAVPALDTDLTFVGELGIRGYGDQDAATTLAQLGREFDELPETFDGPVRAIASSGPTWFVQLDALDAGPLGDGRALRLRPVVDSGSADRIVLTAGAAPVSWTGDSSDELDPSARPPLDILLSADAASGLGLAVGDVVPSVPAPLRVSGLFEPDDAADPYWQHDPRLLDERDTTLPGGLTVAETSAYLAPGSLDGLDTEAQAADLQLWYPTAPERVSYERADALLLDLRRIDAAGLTLSAGQLLRFSTGLPAAIERVQQQVAAADALLALIGSAPLGVVFAVLLLGARTTAARRSSALRLSSARGASPGSLRAATLLEGLVIAVPAGAIAVVAALALVPDDASALALVPALLVAAVVPAYLLATGRASGDGRSRLDLGRVSRHGRVTLEIAVISLAVVAVVLLDRRGLTAASASVGVDPLLAATPLLASLAVCVVVLRVYPLPLLALQRRMSARRGAVGLLGAARAVRDPSLGFGSVLAIVVAVGTAVFAVVLATTVSSGISAAADERVGADLRLDAGAVPAAAVERIAALDGVADAVPLTLVPATEVRAGSTTVTATLVVADLGRLAALRPAIPSRIDGGGAIPFVASAGFVDRVRVQDLSIGDERATRVAQLNDLAIPDAGSQWILVDRADAARLVGTDPEATRLLVRLDDGADASAIASRLRGEVLAAGPAADATPQPVTVEDAASVTAGIEAQPTVGALTATLRLSALIALGLGCLAIAVASIGAAASRNRVIAVVRLLGMSRRQFRGLVAWELVPALAIAGAAGVVLGLALPVLVTSLVDLRDFVGGAVPVGAVVPVPAVVAVAVGFAAAAAASGAVAVAIASRIDPASDVRIGAE